MTRCSLPFACMAVFLVTGMANAGAQTALELTDRARKDLQAFEDAKKTEITKAEDARKASPSATTMSSLVAAQQEENALRNALSTIQGVRNSVASGDNENALLELSHIAPFGNLPREMQPTFDALNQRIRTEQADKLAAYTKDIDSTCQRAAAAVLQAKEAKDLDDSLKDLKRASELPAVSVRYSDERSFATKVNYAIGFVTHWQDYLIARSRNEDGNVRTILQNLTMETKVPLIPRSEILARIPQAESDREAVLRARRAGSSRPSPQIDTEAREIVQGVKKLDDVAAALAKLVDLRTEESGASGSYRSDSVLNGALQGLESLQRSILEYRNGLTPNIGQLLSRTEYASHPEINLALWSLRLQLVREAAPHLMDVPADGKPGDDEPVGVYLRRLIESAKARQDWAAVIQGLQILRMLSTLDNNNLYGSGNELDTTVYQNLLSAADLEKAAQYTDAVAMYLTVLHVGQPRLPAAWIGQHLADIQKAHPEEYKRARGITPEESRAAYIKTLRGYRNEFGTLMSDPSVETAADAPKPSPASTPTPTPTPTATPAPKP